MIWCFFSLSSYSSSSSSSFFFFSSFALVLFIGRYFDHAILLVAMCKAGVELAYECMVEVGMKPESAYYESLHEAPLIANL